MHRLSSRNDYMKILVEQPPIIDRIIAVFPFVKDEKNMLYAYGDVIYSPGGADVPPYKIVHEMVHGEQQREVGVEWWWDTYLVDKVFRLNEEIPAHHADYKSFCRHYKDKNEQLRYLNYLAGQLSGPIYGNLITHSEAMRRIKHGTE